MNGDGVTKLKKKNKIENRKFVSKAKGGVKKIKVKLI